MTPRDLSSTTPNQALEALKEGNSRFVKNQRESKNLLKQMEATKDKQEPFAVVVSCMDSRTAPELIFDQGLGDIFTIRIAGNVVTPEVVGSVEYACAAVGSKAVLVLGHTACGAIKGTLDNVQLGQLGSITSRIKGCIHDNANMDEATTQNVQAGIEALKKESPILQDLINQNKLKIVGGIYDVKTGLVSFMDS